jgi:hypothetical protein
VPIQKQIKDFFDHSGGVNKESSDTMLQDNEYDTLDNIVLSNKATLGKRKGYQKVGDSTSFSTEPIKGLDRYLTESSEHLMMSTDKKLYQSVSTGLNSSNISLNSTLTLIEATVAQQEASTATLTFAGGHGFIAGDDLTVEIAAVEYIWLVESVTSPTVLEVSGVSSYPALGAVAELCYGSRVSEVVPVVDGSGFIVSDMVILNGFERHFQITAIDTNNITLDEEVYWGDASVPNAMTVAEKWVGIKPPEATSYTLFDASTEQQYLSSSMIKNNLMMTDGVNEPLNFDGTELTKLGFHEAPDIIKMGQLDDIIWRAPGAGSANVYDSANHAGIFSYKMSYDSYDVNGRLTESGLSDLVKVELDDVAGYDVFIPVIPINKGFQDDLYHNLDRCDVNLYRTTLIGTDYYLAISRPMNTLGSWLINKVVNVVGATTTIHLEGSPDISFLTTEDYIYVNMGTATGVTVPMKVASFDDAADTITLTNTSAAAADDIGDTTYLVGYAATCIVDSVNDETLVTKSPLYSNKGVEEINDIVPIAKYTTSFDNRLWMSNGVSYPEMLISVLDETVFANGDTIELSDGTVSEIYEITDGTPTAGNIRIYRDFTLVTDFIRTLGETINANPEGKWWSYYGENLTDPENIAIRTRQVAQGTPDITITLATTSGMTKIRLDNIPQTLADSGVAQGITPSEYGSRVWWSKLNEPTAFVATFGSTVSQQVFWEDIEVDNGQSITGIMPLAGMLIVFKEDSCFRLVSSGNDSYSYTGIDTEIGCIAPKSIINIGGKVLFLSRYGVYSTDGYSTSFVGKKIRREWLAIDEDNIKNSTATHNVRDNQYWVSVPYGEDQEENNMLFVYDYLRRCWSRFTGVEATLFTKIREDVYFGTPTGEIYSVRNTGTKYDYRDNASEIEATIITKWYDMGNKSARKMFQRLITHFYQTSAESTIEMYYAYDFNEEWDSLGTLQLVTDSWGDFEWGPDQWGATSFEPHKQPLSPQKSRYARFKFVNAGLDNTLDLQGISLEVKMLNTEAISQEE